VNLLVTGGTGTVGSAVARELLARGARVKVLTRSAEKAKACPAGVEPMIGDLLDPAAVRSVFRGAEGVFLLNPVSATETHEGLMAINGARLAGVRRIAYLSIHHVDRFPHLPHFGSKIAVETAIRHSGIAFTMLRANNFYQNDYWFRDALLQYGVYPQPIGGIGCSRVDVRDIAELAALALTSGAHDGRSYDIAGPDALTGQRTAEIWSRALGRPVAYGGDDLDAWEKQAIQMLPPWMAFDFRLMYEEFQKHGLLADAPALERLTNALGHPPRRYEDFVAETARSWKG
jgi:uncharacterized protein YbjT (DUF2867 family)